MHLEQACKMKSTMSRDKTHEVDYSIDAIKSKILKLIKKPSETLVVCEATGGLEYTLVDVLHDVKIDVVVANLARIRDFAKGHGFLEKSEGQSVCRRDAEISANPDEIRGFLDLQSVG